MTRKVPFLHTAAAILTTWVVMGLVGSTAGALYGKEKAQASDPNDPTFRLFQLLDNSYGGKLADFYMLADIYKDPKNPSQEFQRVLRLEYDKNRGFGKLSLYVRSVDKMQPEQLKVYTPKMVYEFAVADSEKFVKTEPGLFGKTGDLYLRSTDDRPLASSPITDDLRKVYEHFVTDHLLPALQKK